MVGMFLAIAGRAILGVSIGFVVGVWRFLGGGFLFL